MRRNERYSNERYEFKKCKSWKSSDSFRIGNSEHKKNAKQPNLFNSKSSIIYLLITLKVDSQSHFSKIAQKLVLCRVFRYFKLFRLTKLNKSDSRLQSDLLIVSYCIEQVGAPNAHISLHFTGIVSKVYDNINKWMLFSPLVRSHFSNHNILLEYFQFQLWFCNCCHYYNRSFTALKLLTKTDREEKEVGKGKNNRFSAKILMDFDSRKFV